MPTDPPEGYVSSAEACRALNISDRTLRRRVRAGAIAGEYVARPQGTILYVKLPEDVAARQAAASGDAANDPEDAARGTQQDAAIVAALLERLDGKDAALLAATERAVRAEAERDAALKAAEAATSERGRIERELTARLADVESKWRAELDRPWWKKLLGR